MTHKLAFRNFRDFFRVEAASGVVLLICTVLAIAWANSPWSESYTSVWHQHLFGAPLHRWINDGLMAVFFFVVGLEIKRELLTGELSSPKKAYLPVLAALGGMVVPALIFAAINRASTTAAGWGIPMATDIAFALGVLTLLGKRVPSSLKVFLTAFAIIDDLGAVLIIALFYTQKISWLGLGLDAVILALLLAVNHIGITKTWTYLILGCALWFAFLKSGIHPTIAGVLTALAIPARSEHPARLEHLLHPWVSFAIMPIFALANAGVLLWSNDSQSIAHPVFLGVFLGLVFGKQVGITLFSYLGVRCGLAQLPSGIHWRQIFGVACLGGIGFTMSLFISALAFPGDLLLIEAKLGILAASVASGVLGWLVLRQRASA